MRTIFTNLIVRPRQQACKSYMTAIKPYGAMMAHTCPIIANSKDSFAAPLLD